MENLSDFFAIFNNREIATFFWLFMFAVLFLRSKSIRKSFWGIVKIFMHYKILSIILLMFLYIILFVVFLKHINVWNITHLKDTIFWSFGSAIVVLFKTSRNLDDKLYFKNIIIDGFKISLLIEFIVSFNSFNIFVELIQLPIITILVIIVEAGNSDARFSNARPMANNILIIYGITIIIISIVYVVSNISILYNFQTYFTFLLPLIFQTLIIPYLYLFSVFLSYEKLFSGINMILGKDSNEARFAKLESVKKFQLNLRKIEKYKTSILRDLTREMNKEDIMKIFNNI